MWSKISMMISRTIMSHQKRLYEFGIRCHVSSVTITCFQRESKFWKALKYRICWLCNNEIGRKTSKTKSPYSSDGPWTHYQKGENGFMIENPLQSFFFHQNFKKVIKLLKNFIRLWYTIQNAHKIMINWSDYFLINNGHFKPSPIIAGLEISIKRYYLFDCDF